MDATVKKSDTYSTKKQKHPDRITLPPSALEKLGRWIDLLQNKSAGIKVTRSDLVTWLINSHSENLSTSEISDLEGKFFDNLKYAKWAVKEIMEARARGEVLNLRLVGNESKVGIASSKRDRKKKENPTSKTSLDSTLINSKSFSESTSVNEKDIVDGQMGND